MSSIPARVVGRFGAIVGRLILVAIIAVATAVLIGAMFLPGALAANQLLTAVQDEVLDIPPLGEADTPPQNSFIYATDGTELAEITFEENRVPVDFEDIPDVVIDAVLATEDANYYEHDGVNHLAIARAAVSNLRAGGIESGASTITQQYVKMTFLSPEQTLARKLEEALYALQLEDELDKDEILERYLNRSYFGRGTYGIGTAAERYFGKDLEELSLGEAAMLAGLLRAPEANNPINSMENAQARRDIVLRQMAQHGFVSAPQAQTAIDQELEVDVSEPPPPDDPFWTNWISQLLINENNAGALDPHFRDRVDAPLNVQTLLGETSEERRETVFQGGLRIHTTLDPELQAEAEDALARQLTFEDQTPAELASEPLGSIVSVEPGTGAIRAMGLGPREFGSCSEDGSWVEATDDGRLLCDRTQVNPAMPGGGGTGRQPGSAFKPVLNAAALEDGVSAGLVLDAQGPQDIDGCETSEGPYTVRNTGGDGILDMYEAVAQSSNVYHALLIADIGPERAADMMERLSGYAVADRDVVCSLALGANSTTPLAMANAYATLANRGEYCAAHPIERIEDANGQVIWEYEPNCEQVIDTEVADRIVDILEGPVSEGGTAPGANLGEWPTRGKTGSTNDNIDAWFVGFVKQLSTAAWIGYPNETRTYETEADAQAACGDDAGDANQGLVDTQCPAVRQRLRDTTIGGQYYDQVFGGTIPAPMWHDYMSRVVERYEPEGFEDPGPIPTTTVPDLLQASSIEEAEDIAFEAGFRLTTEEVEDWRPAGDFVDQTPSAGSEAALGSQITLGISDGTGDLPTVPDVLGMTVSDAVNTLEGAGYTVEGRRDTETDDPDLIERVVATNPGPGQPLSPETGTVILDVGVAPEEPEEPEEPDEPDDGDDEDDNGNGGNDNGNGGNGNGGNGNGGNGNGGNGNGGNGNGNGGTSGSGNDDANGTDDDDGGD